MTKLAISKEDLNALPPFSLPVRWEVIDRPEQVSTAVKELEKAPILGFDTETRPSFTKGETYQVAMLQLATAETSYLFRLNRIGLPAELAAILERKDIVKAGVAIHDDLKGLQKLRSFRPDGFVDLAREAEKRGITTFGLRALAGIFLGQRLSKAAKVTNWERSTLTEAQMKYAAYDALVGLLIYQKMF